MEPDVEEGTMHEPMMPAVTDTFFALQLAGRADLEETARNSATVSRAAGG